MTRCLYEWERDGDLINPWILAHRGGTAVINGMSVLHHDRVYIWLAEQFVAFGLPLALLLTGSGARLCHACERIARGRWFWTAVLFASVYVLLSILLTLPIDFLASQRLPAWGLPAQGVGHWGVEEAGDALRLILIGAVLGWIPFWITRWSRRHWWAWTGGVAALGIATLLLIRPIWIDQLSAPYTVLEDPTWQQRIDRLGQRVGFNHVHVLIQHLPSDAGCDTATVEGIGPTRRLILSEGIFSHSPERDVTAIVAHELKHYWLDATWKPLVVLAGFIVAAMLTIPLMCAAALRRWSERFGFSSLTDPASLPLLVLNLRLFLLVAVPVFNLLSQHIEHEADRFALELTRDNEAVAHEVAACSPHIKEQNWFDRLYFDNHLSPEKRAQFALSYRPWEQGKPLVYGR